MFDVAFSELIVIAVVALIVIGPEKLPKVARMLGALTGRMQRYVAQVKEEVNREVRFQELQQLQQEIQEAANKTQANLQQSTDALMQDLHESAHSDAAQGGAVQDNNEKSGLDQTSGNKTALNKDHKPSSILRDTNR